MRSAIFSTPVDVARRAARMLVRDASTRVLDVGSGAGKFCLIGALTTVGHFTGIEQRGRLVGVARTVAASHGVTRAAYIHGDIRDVSWEAFDAFYFFNPFEENCFTPHEFFDESVDLTPERRIRDLDFVAHALERVRIGSRVVAYHGVGCEFPKSYQSKRVQLAGTNVLELWEKTS